MKQLPKAITKWQFSSRRYEARGRGRLLVTRYCMSKNVEPRIWPYFKNIVVDLLVAISISFEPQDEI